MKGKMAFPGHSSSVADSISLNMCFQLLCVCCGLERETSNYARDYTEKSPTLHGQWKSIEKMTLNWLEAESGLQAVIFLADTWKVITAVQNLSDHRILSLETNGLRCMCSEWAFRLLETHRCSCLVQCWSVLCGGTRPTQTLLSATILQ